MPDQVRHDGLTDFMEDINSFVGTYLELACLPVGRVFGDWNFKKRGVAQPG